MGAQPNLKVVPGLPPAPAPRAQEKPHCRLCGCRLNGASSRSMRTGLCAECRERPEALRLGDAPAEGDAARQFTIAEKSMIAKMHRFLPADELLRLLNERLSFDLGPDASSYTMVMLRKEIETLDAPSANDGSDWSALRKRLAIARKSGVLDAIDRQTIDDFAVVYSLNSAQVLRLKDILLPIIEGDAP